jgi:anti-anti-sigma regulatory factor
MRMGDDWDSALVIDRCGSGARLRLQGMSSKAAHAHLAEALAWMIEEAGCQWVIVELDSLEHIDTAYVQMLRSAQQRLRRRDGTLTVILARPELSRILALSAVGEVLPVDGPTGDRARSSSPADAITAARRRRSKLGSSAPELSIQT